MPALQTAQQSGAAFRILSGESPTTAVRLRRIPDPAASFPLLAAQRGVPYVIINRGATDHDHEPSVTLRIEGDVLEIFPAAVEAALA